MAAPEDFGAEQTQQTQQTQKTQQTQQAQRYSVLSAASSALSPQPRGMVPTPSSPTGGQPERFAARPSVALELEQLQAAPIEDRLARTRAALHAMRE